MEREYDDYEERVGAEEKVEGEEYRRVDGELYQVEKTESFDTDEFFSDLRDWFGAKQHVSRIDRFMNTWIHAFMTVATGGLWMLGYIAYYFLKFLDEYSGKEWNVEEERLVKVEG